MRRPSHIASPLVAGALSLALVVAGPALAGPHGHGGGGGPGGGGRGGGPGVGPGGGHSGGGGWHPGSGPGRGPGGPRPAGPPPRWSGGHGPGWSGPRWGGGGWGGHRVWVRRSPGVFIGGGFVYDPFVYPYYGYAYPPAYAPGYYGYPPTYAPGAYPTYSDPNSSEPSYPDYPPPGYEGEPDSAPDTEATPPPQYVPPPGAEAAPSDDYGSSYGLVQLLEVPDGATVDLDQRPWVDARGLSDRWLALPAGMHSLTVRAAGYAPAERRVDIASGRPQVVKIGPLRALTASSDEQ